ncbi:hypothetical protein H257_01100 [Aphanomyces astaci]|uniref:Uncharacterized protein n=1 Tax=Aphanomyces astaci TaxID=112090 RepID=W4H8J3_APHAT|nr:hypothetical protein H257_01100 [Aphanomyces astaci]ETV87574.1 hypothetical protein H257_01100 [Aphanomyces astaci]RQM19838.1 hypothetical protein B5M09_002996 [Aphanomyces astaci]|eukprot:XP_009822437.1 hypothetical protein H257_01100 [Aphanomyces astaci]
MFANQLETTMSAMEPSEPVTTPLHLAMRQFDLARDAAAKAMDTMASTVVELASLTSPAAVTNETLPSTHSQDTNDVDAAGEATTEAANKAKVLDEFVAYLTTVLEIKNPTRLASLAQAFVWNRDDALVDDFVAEGFNIVLYAKRANSPPVVCSPLVAKKPVLPPTNDTVTFNDKLRQRSGSINDLTVRQIRILQGELEKEAKAREESPVTHLRRTTVTPSPSHLSLELLDKDLALYSLEGNHDDDEAGPSKKRRVTPEPDNTFVEQY